MATLCNQDDCTSCLSCYNTCPFNAISVGKNLLSVKVPHIDNAICRECGLCEKSCPIINNSLGFTASKRAVALYTRDENDIKTCSSGGVATTFAKNIIQNGGVVYGATASGQVPGFYRASKLEDVELLKGSKYVYCNPQLTYRAVKDDLINGIECLFIGLPCQVAGLKQFLRKDYSNLYMIDLICHGTPPFEYLKAHIELKIGNYSPKCTISFRGRRDFYTTVYDSHGSKLYSKNQYEDEYFAAFMRGWIYNPACYNCRFAKPERISDITIGDFWGLEKGALNNYNGKISVALINTEQGQNLFDISKDNFNWEYRNIEEAINGNAQLRKPTQLVSEAKTFQSVYSNTQSLDDAYRACGIYKIVRTNRIRRLLLAFPKMLRCLIKSIVL